MGVKITDEEKELISIENHFYQGATEHYGCAIGFLIALIPMILTALLLENLNIRGILLYVVTSLISLSYIFVISVFGTYIWPLIIKPYTKSIRRAVIEYKRLNDKLKITIEQNARLRKEMIVFRNDLYSADVSDIHIKAMGHLIERNYELEAEIRKTDEIYSHY